MQTLTFSVKGESFAAGIETIKEIIEHPEISGVPLTPAFLRGLMNLRGEVIPVIDLADRFSLGLADEGRRVIIFEVTTPEGRQTLGVVVDAVHEVVDISPHQIDPAPDFGTQISPHFLRGMLRLDGKIVLLLDLDKVLSIEQLEGLMASFVPPPL